jgi:phosphoesterase RecJ-like protein
MHINPDGDAIGASLALAEMLQSIGKRAVVYCRDRVPDLCSFMPGHEEIVHSYDPGRTSDSTLVVVDCNTDERAAVDASAFKKSIVIDHHMTEKPFGDIKWVEPSICATGLMIYHIGKALDIPLTSQTALNLYAAISVDTGTFRYSNTTPDTMTAAAELIRAGAKPAIVANHLYNEWSRQRFTLLKEVLKTLEIYGDTAMISATEKMMDETGAKPEDTENFVNFPNMINSINVSVFFRETGGGVWKASLRSKDTVNVAEVAEVFGGGGHKNAAGFRTKEDLGVLKKKLLDYFGPRSR